MRETQPMLASDPGGLVDQCSFQAMTKSSSAEVLSAP